MQVWAEVLSGPCLESREGPGDVPPHCLAWQVTDSQQKSLGQPLKDRSSQDSRLYVTDVPPATLLLRGSVKVSFKSDEVVLIDGAFFPH